MHRGLAFGLIASIEFSNQETWSGFCHFLNFHLKKYMNKDFSLVQNKFLIEITFLEGLT